MKYIVMLRGINVSGYKIIKMSDLKNAFEALDFKNVKTYVQSGNVVFDSALTDILELNALIDKKIVQVFGFSVKIIIITAAELANIIEHNPFIKEKGIEQDKLHITFLSEIPKQETIEGLEVRKEENEKFEIISREIYLYCPNGYGNTKLNNAVFEKKLNMPATTRNWKTVNSLLGMAKQDIE